MKLPVLNGADFSFSASPSSLVCCMHESVVWGWKINEKKAVFPHCLCYIRKNSLPKEKPSFAKKEKQFLIKTLSFSCVLRSHTPFYCLLEFHSSRPKLITHTLESTKTSGKIVERKTKEKKFFGLCVIVSWMRLEKARKRRVDVYVDMSGRRNSIDKLFWSSVSSWYLRASGRLPNEVSPINLPISPRQPSSRKNLHRCCFILLFVLLRFQFF